MILLPFFEIPYGDRLAKNVNSQYVQVIPRSTPHPSLCSPKFKILEHIVWKLIRTLGENLNRCSRAMFFECQKFKNVNKKGLIWRNLKWHGYYCIMLCSCNVVLLMMFLCHKVVSVLCVALCPGIGWVVGCSGLLESDSGAGPVSGVTTASVQHGVPTTTTTTSLHCVTPHHNPRYSVPSVAPA